MDFGSLLHAAQKNEHKAKQEPKKCYSTTFSAPKKEQRDNRNLSANIQKFLARRDQEEKRKEDDAKKKRDDLLALRSQDGKAKKRVAAMLKRTKAANKSAIEDAVDDDNTAVTLDGPSQPDEDDYGYVSQEASAYYNKLMDKYNHAPAEEPLYSQKKKVVHRDLNSTKDRVRMALLKEEEEEMMPHKRRRRVKSKKEDDPGDKTIDYRSSDLTDLGPCKEAEIDSEEEQERQLMKPPPKKKPAAPPTMNFHDLLKLAEKKQFEPIKIEPKKKPEDDERPMTKKQRVEFMKEQEWRQRKEEAARGGQVNQPPKIPKVNRKDDSTQIQRPDPAYARQERTSGIGQQAKIPRINNVKREEKTVIYPKEEDRYANNSKKEDRLMSNMRRSENIGPPRHNENLNRENSYSAASKANVIKVDKAIRKIPKDSSDIAKKQRGDNESILFRKSQIYEERERNKSIRSDNSVSNTMKNIPLRSSDGRQNSENVSIIKNSSLSGYDKKLQEAIMTKMQECQKKKVEEGTLTKPAGKSFQGRDSESKVSKNNERNNWTIQSQGKLFSNPDRLVEQKSNLSNLKQSSSSNNRPPQDRNLQNRPSSVPPSKPRVIPPEGKSKSMPSTSRSAFGGDIRAKPNTQSQVRAVDIPDGRSKAMPPPGARPKQISSSEPRPKQTTQTPADVRPRQFPPPEVKSKQIPPADKSRPLPSDVKPRQLPSADVKSRQFPPADVKPRQFPPADVKSRQFPPADVRRKQFPPPDVKRNSKSLLKRRITDSDEEYDSEMDDFIDDGPQEEEDYSKHIREIFGYDRRKYSRIEDDDEDECMESNFATILKEDFISTKTGILEDLEDIRREKEMERKKKLAKKRK